MRIHLCLVPLCLLGVIGTATAELKSRQPAPEPAAGRSLSYEFPGVEVGVAENEDGPTGVTVIRFATPAMAAIDVRGGAPGTVNSDALHVPHDAPFVAALTLAGGSAYGLSAITGVANGIKEATDNAGDWRNVAVVPGAIIFDLGDRRYNAVTPDDALGRAALKAIRAGAIPLGARGAGRFAMQSGYSGDRQNSGQGAAFRQAGAIKVLVVTVVNAVGTIVDRSGQVVRCSHPVNGSCGSIESQMAAHLASMAAVPVASTATAGGSGLTANTTVTVVVTNQALPFSMLQRLAIQVHNSMSRAIQPFGTAYDGDTLFAATTGEIKSGGLDPISLGVLASETAWDAVLASPPVLPVPPARVATTVSARDAEAYAGNYSFTAGVTAAVSRRDAGLVVTVTGRDSLYLPAGKAVALTPVGVDEFELGTPRADRLHIDRDDHGRVVGLTINPGPWPIRAKRITTH